jgi:hypothetical protein
MAVPKFCRHCGEDLVYREEDWFDAYTGERQPIKFLECPFLKHGRYQWVHPGIWLFLNE